MQMQGQLKISGPVWRQKFCERPIDCMLISTARCGFLQSDELANRTNTILLYEVKELGVS